MVCSVPHFGVISLTMHQGRFLLGVLTDLYKWYQDEQMYLQDNRIKAGGKAVWLPGFQHPWSNKAAVEPSAILSWSKFQQILRKWQRKLCKVRALVHADLNVVDYLLLSVFLRLHWDGRVHARLQHYYCLEGNTSCVPACSRFRELRSASEATYGTLSGQGTAR